MLRHAAKPSTRRIAVGARALSSNSLLKQRLIELMPEKQAALKKLKTEHGAKIVDKVTIDQLIGGARSIKCMLWETSQLDAMEGIRFRGLTIPELQEKLPTHSGVGSVTKEEPIPEGMLWLLLTGEVPTKEQADSVTAEQADSAATIFACIALIFASIHCVPMSSSALVDAQNSMRKFPTKSAAWSLAKVMNGGSSKGVSSDPNCYGEAYNYMMRSQGSLSVLKESAGIDWSAYLHVQDMGIKGYFSHYSPNGEGPGQRLKKVCNVGGSWTYTENLAWSSAMKSPLAYQVQLYNDCRVPSRGHRKNIIKPDVTETGCGEFKFYVCCLSTRGHTTKPEYLKTGGSGISAACEARASTDAQMIAVTTDGVYA